MLDFAPDCRSDTDLMLAGYDFTTVAAGETAVEDNLLSHLIASRRETAGNGVRTFGQSCRMPPMAFQPERMSGFCAH